MEVFPTDEYLSNADAALLPAGIQVEEFEFNRAVRANELASQAASEEFLALLREGTSDLVTRIETLEQQVLELRQIAATFGGLEIKVNALVAWALQLNAILSEPDE